MPHPAVYAVTIGAAVVLGIGAAIIGYLVLNEGEERHHEHEHRPRHSMNKTESDFEYIDSGSQCTICLDNIRSTQNCIYRKCGHIFHKNCLDQWHRCNNTCPNCRK